MSDDKRWDVGIETFKKVYGDVLPAPPKELAGDFGTMCIEQQSGEVWSRTVMSVRDRRVAVLGVVAALGEETPFRIHAEAALRNREITATELNELLIFLTSYIGYPRATKIKPVVDQLVRQFS